MSVPTYKIQRTFQRGFTLIEVLLVVAIISVLAGIVIIAVNPNKQFGDTRDSQRAIDVKTIIDAVYQYTLDVGQPGTISTTPTEICATGASPCTSLVDLTVLTTNGKYLVSIPKDPQCATVCATNGVGYNISHDSSTSKRVTVTAPYAENHTITVTR